MHVISATILDATRLELSEPLAASPGEVIQVSFPSSDEIHDDDMTLWREAGKKHLLDAYADEDAVYDNL